MRLGPEITERRIAAIFVFPCVRFLDVFVGDHGGGVVMVDGWSSIDLCVYYVMAGGSLEEYHVGLTM